MAIPLLIESIIISIYNPDMIEYLELEEIRKYQAIPLCEAERCSLVCDLQVPSFGHKLVDRLPAFSRF